MLELLLVTVALISGTRSELVATVTPELVQPGVTASFSVNCALLEAEELIVASMSLSRQTISTSVGQTTAEELIGTIRSSSPSAPVVQPGFEQQTLLGQITSLESELGTFLKVLWAKPTIEDLGTYICKTTVVGQMGELLTFSARASVTTSDLTTDRLLVALQSLEGNFDSFNQTLQDVQAGMDNLTSRVEALETEREVTPDVPVREETTKPTDVTEEEVVAPEEAVPEEPTEDRTEKALGRLAIAIENIDTKLDVFNQSLSNLERKLEQAELEAEVDEEAANDTKEEKVMFDVIQNYFIYENSSYFLFKGNTNTDTYRAQAICESKRLYLAEVNSDAEFQAIGEEMEFYVQDENLVLVGGQKRAGQQDWRFQESGELVTFFAWGPGEPVETRNSECLAVRPASGGADMVAVSCSADQDFYFLCEGDL